MRKNFFATSLAVFAAAILTANSSHAQVVDLNLNQEDVRVLGEFFSASDSSGYSIAYGDIDRNGFDDLVIGAPYADPAQRVDAGKVYIIYADAAGFIPPPPPPAEILNLPGPLPLGYQVTIIEGATRGDRLGWSVATGDIDGDTFSDVIIGAPSAQGEEFKAGGKTYVIYSRGGALKTIPILVAAPALGLVTEIHGGATDIQSGWSVSSGKINGDKFDDVIIGAPFADSTYAPSRPAGTPRPPRRRNAGATYVVYSTGVLPAIFFLRNPASEIVEIFGSNAGDASGRAAASGNLNADASDDVIIGAPSADNANGATYVVSGKSSAFLVTPFDLAAPADPIAIVQGGFLQAGSGWSVASGNIDNPMGQGFEDLIIGAPFFSSPGVSGIGDSYLFFGPVQPGIGYKTSAADFTVHGAHPRGLFGWSVASGDFDNDTLDDVLIGAPIADPVRGAGEAYAVFAQDH